MASRKIADLHPMLQPLCAEFLEKAKDKGIDVLLICTYRSAEEQAQLYAKGRNGTPGPIVTNAKPGESEHNFTIGGKPAARAFDVVPMLNGKCIWDVGSPLWQMLGKIGLELGLDWYGAPGSSFKEYPHFCLPKPKRKLTLKG
jgi:peptidoglycan LD-endopeptidase CwlK